MSDARSRGLARRAAQGDPQAAAAAAREACRTSAGHGLAVEVQGFYESNFGLAPGLIRVGLPHLTLTAAKCAACREDAPYPAEDVVREVLASQPPVDVTRGTFAVTVETTCRNGHLPETGRLYWRMIDDSDRPYAFGSQPWQVCVRCGVDIPYSGTVS